MTYRKDSVDILYKNLPSIYRERDKEQGYDLYHYLSAFGHVLDLTRHTLEQRYVDSFPDNGDLDNQCQDWLVPYFADLFAVELRSPTRHGQRNEVSNAVRWAQRKGTLGTAEEIIEAISLLEGVVQEGWKRVATTARIGLPIRDAISMGESSLQYPDTGTDNPLRASEIARHPGMPNVTPDTRFHSRAVETDAYNPAAQSWSGNKSLKVWPFDDSDPEVIDSPSATQIYWRQIHPHGASCFGGGPKWGDSYQDVSVRTPDVRSPQNAVGEVIGGFHPKRLIAFLPSPEGICVAQSVEFHRSALEADILAPFKVAINLENEKVEEERRSIAEIIEALGLTRRADIQDPAQLKIRNFLTLNVDQGGTLVLRNETSHSLRITGNLTLTDDINIRFEKLRFTNFVIQEAGTAFFYRCAIKYFTSTVNSGLMKIHTYFQDCLLRNLRAENSTVQCEYVTVLNEVKTQRLLASDCIFAINEPSKIDPGVEPCIRYSRIILETLASQNRNTTANIGFASSGFAFCEPGCGVLSSECPDPIRFGAEDGGEMGVYHAWHLAAQDSALTLKLLEYLPVGIKPVIVRDRTLNCKPPSPDTAP